MKYKDDKPYSSKKYKEHDYVQDLLTKSQSADQDMRDQARECALFLDKRDGQWEAKWLSQAKNQKKPRYTFDLVNPIVDQICSEITQAEFDVKIAPAGGNATQPIANTYDGIIRNIETMSDASDVYSESARGMVVGGFDAWRVSQKYIDDDSFEQDLVIEKIGNAVDRVFFDPAAEKQDKSDSRYCFVLHAVSKEEYQRRWPDGSEESVSEGRDGDAYYDKAEVIVIGEFIYCEESDRELVMFDNGSVHESDNDLKKLKDEFKAMGVNEIQRRKRVKKTICSRFFDAKDWLDDKSETVFSRMPVVPIYANYRITENKSIYWGVVEKLLDPQRVLNYSMSREIEEGALAPRAKFMMTPAQASGHEDSLSTLNTNSEPVQFYNPDPDAPGIPQQVGGAIVNPGLRTISESMRGMITYASGMYSANMGDNPGLQSGVAIEQLQNKGDNSTLKYFSALETGIRATGRILVEAIPKVYNTARTVRILKEDQTYDVAPINTQQIDQQTGEVVTLNDLSIGLYDVSVRAGASFKNRQKETIDTIIEIAKIDPTILQIAGDVLLDNVSTASAQQISDRKREQMLSQGMIPQSQMTQDELAAMAQAQQQPPAPDPAMLIAEAEMGKAQAEQLRAQIEGQKVQNETMRIQLEAQKMQNTSVVEQAKSQVDIFNAQTSRLKVEVDAEKAGAAIDNTDVKTFGEEIDNQRKIQEMQNESRMRSMSTPDLMRIANGG
tara:strand:+ start:3579 stop:5750 length:2172 start_codon:yes stop_codon:yes gene_type:complete